MTQGQVLSIFDDLGDSTIKHVLQDCSTYNTVQIKLICTQKMNKISFFVSSVFFSEFSIYLFDIMDAFIAFGFLDLLNVTICS